MPRQSLPRRLSPLLFGLGLALGSVMPAAALDLRAGPMPGAPAQDGAVIWLQGDSAGEAQLEYWVTGETPRHRSAVHPLSAEDAYVAHVRLNGLAPGKQYTYRVLLDGKPVEVGGPLQFRTLSQGEPPDFTIATGSCSLLPDPAEVIQIGGDYGIFDRIAALQPDLMLWLGDNLYFRPQDVALPGGQPARYWQTRQFPGLQRLLRGTHHLAIWDDHDFGWNNSDARHGGKQESLRLFKQYWANPSYGQPDHPGTYGVVRLHDVDLFLLDDRYHRDPDEAPESPQKSMFGARQMAWLKQELSRSTATFKLVVNGNQLLNHDRAGETWRLYPHERRQFLDWLEGSGIPGVVFLSGDRHYTELLKLSRRTAYTLYELTSSPLTSPPSGFRRKSPNGHVVPGTFLRERNFATLTFAGQGHDRALTMRVYDATGRQRWQYVLPVRLLR